MLLLQARFRLYFILVALFLTLSSSSYAKIHDIPDELYEGLVKFELNSGRYFDALVLMDSAYQSDNYVDYLTALQGFDIRKDLSEKIEKAKQKKNLTDNDYYKIGRLEYFQDDCLPTLKTFKKIQNNQTLTEKEPWAFYRANCFIKLGSNVRAGQALNDVVGGIWAAYAYYNLAISYSETSRDSTRALGALYIADQLNKGTSREAKALNDKINLVAGKLYLDAKKYDQAIQFFKKIYLDSDSTPPGLYFNGLALLESGDFRAATQIWHSLKTYSVLNQSVAEAYLAIPFAFERSGYLSQTIEAYLDASTTFESEIEMIKKIDALLNKYTASQIFIEDSEVEGLEWFLAKDIVKNTTRAVYYQHFMKDESLHDQVKLFSELKMLQSSLDFWSSQLIVFDQTLNNKKRSFQKEKNSFDPSVLMKKIEQQKSKLSALSNHSGMTNSLRNNLQIDVLSNSVEVLKIRLEKLKESVQKGEGQLNSQLQQINLFNKKIDSVHQRLNKLITNLDKEITKSMRAALAELNNTMLSNYERSEQGRIHLFEDMAESKEIKKTNLLDGRYQ